MPDHLPKYATRLNALHQALQDDFRQIVSNVPLHNGQIVLDVGCGDGFFTSLLAEHRVEVIGIDNSLAFLREAQATTAARHVFSRATSACAAGHSTGDRRYADTSGRLSATPTLAA